MSNVTLIEPASGISVTGRMGPMSPQISGGTKINEIDRTGFKPLTTSDGQSLIRQQFEIILDGFPDRSVQGDIAALEAFAGIGAHRLGLAVLRISGIALRFTEIDWLLESIEPGDLIERSAAGLLLRQDYKLSLVEANVPARIPTSVGTGPRSYRVKKGDTLKRIAKKTLGSSKRWKEVARYNVLKSNKQLKVGMLLRIPPR